MYVPASSFIVVFLCPTNQSAPWFSNPLPASRRCWRSAWPFRSLFKSAWPAVNGCPFGARCWASPVVNALLKHNGGGNQRQTTSNVSKKHAGVFTSLPGCMSTCTQTWKHGGEDGGDTQTMEDDGDEIPWDCQHLALVMPCCSCMHSTNSKPKLKIGCVAVCFVCSPLCLPLCVSLPL